MGFAPFLAAGRSLVTRRRFSGNDAARNPPPLRGGPRERARVGANAQQSSVVWRSHSVRWREYAFQSSRLSFRYDARKSLPNPASSTADFSRARSASSRLSGRRRASCALWPSVYMLMSRRLPGSRALRIPSRPAIGTAACRRYGLAAPSPRRNSKRPASGMRIIWVRLLPDQVTALGAQVAPESVG